MGGITQSLRGRKRNPPDSKISSRNFPGSLIFLRGEEWVAGVRARAARKNKSLVERFGEQGLGRAYAIYGIGPSEARDHGPMLPGPGAQGPNLGPDWVENGSLPHPLAHAWDGRGDGTPFAFCIPQREWKGGGP